MCVDVGDGGSAWSVFGVGRTIFWQATKKAVAVNAIHRSASRREINFFIGDVLLQCSLEIRNSLFINTDLVIQNIQSFLHFLHFGNPKPAVLVSGSAIGYYGARGDEDVVEEINQHLNW